MWSPSIISPTGKWEEMYMGTANVFIHWEVLLECGQPQTGERDLPWQEYEDGEGREWEEWGQASIRASSPASTAKVEDGVQWDRWGQSSAKSSWSWYCDQAVPWFCVISSSVEGPKQKLRVWGNDCQLQNHGQWNLRELQRIAEPLPKRLQAQRSSLEVIWNSRQGI